MQAREIRTWTIEEVQSRLEESYREFYALRQQLDMGRLEDHNRLRAVKRDIARMKTVLRERELVADLVEEA